MVSSNETSNMKIKPQLELKPEPKYPKPSKFNERNSRTSNHETQTRASNENLRTKISKNIEKIGYLKNKIHLEIRKQNSTSKLGKIVS